jgi:lipopolysaccharide export system permease protein
MAKRLKHLDRYVLGEFMAPLALVVVGLASLVLLVQFVDTLPRLREWNAKGQEILLIFIFQFPYLATQVLPVGVMLATLTALGSLARTSELAAMGAGGVSRVRIARPLLIAAFGISLALFAVSETIVPAASARSRYIQKVQVEKRDVDYDTPWRNNMAKNLSQGRQLYARDFDARLQTMQDLVVTSFDKQNLRRRLDARAAKWQEGKLWLLYDGVERTFDENGLEKSVRRFKQWPEDLGANPRDFMVDSDKREQDLLQMSIAQLYSIITRLKATGADYQKELVCLHVRISYPFSCLILALLGVSLPYLFPTGRRAITGAALGLLVSLGCGMLYLVSIQIGISLGKSGALPVILAAWLGNIVFAAAGLLVLWKVNR